MVGLIRSFFESGLKTNGFLHFAVVTGCLRVSPESIFTAVNNLDVASVISEGYGEYFGFTQNEVDTLLAYYSLASESQAVKDYYDGYRFRQYEVFNPWSVMCHVRALTENPKALKKGYWEKLPLMTSL